MSEEWSRLLTKGNIEKHVDFWLAEDTPNFDTGGFVVGDKQETALLYGKSHTVLAGVPFVNAVFDKLGCKVEWYLKEGAVIEGSGKNKIVVAKVTGHASDILLGERTALNVISRASGVARCSAAVRAVAEKHGWHGEVAATRKTTPGFRLVEKYALLVGGISTHRYDLSSMVMLKDNHVWSTGSITNAVKKARSAVGFSTKIEVEVRDLEEGLEAGKAGADVIMLDNFDGPDGYILGKENAKKLKKAFPHVIIEASGGITLDTIANYFSPDVDVISMGSLTHGYPCADYSLKIQRESKL